MVIHSLLFPSKKRQAIFLRDHGSSFAQLPCSFFVPSNTSLSTDPASQPVNPEWNHLGDLANLNESTNVITPENSGISAEKSWLEDDISF